MMTPDAFVIALYVLVDDFCKARYTPPTRTGSAASLCASEVLTLALFGQWGWFPSERAFYRYARNHFLTLFPRLPHRAQFNRLVRDHTTVAAALFRHLVELLGAHASPFQALDSAGIATRNLKRRGEGWLPGLADIGWSNRRGWYEGFHLLQSITPEGVVVRVTLKTAPMEQWAIAREMRERILARFAYEGIEIPIPQRMVWHREEPTAASNTAADADRTAASDA